jgi:hypothetical protein
LALPQPLQQHFLPLTKMNTLPNSSITSPADACAQSLEPAAAATSQDDRLQSPQASPMSVRRSDPRTARRGSGARKLTRTDVNFWLDTTLLILFSVLIFVTVVVRFVFPPAEDAEGWSLWSGTMTDWLDAQFVVLALFTLGVVVHLMLHWTWICGVITQRVLPRQGKGRTWNEGLRTIFGVGLMIVILNILGLLIAAAALMIRHP